VIVMWLCSQGSWNLSDRQVAFFGMELGIRSADFVPKEPGGLPSGGEDEPCEGRFPGLITHLSALRIS
jgi:hypothetical protein